MTAGQVKFSDAISSSWSRWRSASRPTSSAIAGSIVSSPALRSVERECSVVAMAASLSGRRSRAFGAAWVAWSRPMLELDRLTRRFGATVALDGLSFTVPPGDDLRLRRARTAPARRPPCGSCSGVLAADAGEARWRGRPIDAATPPALRLHAGGARPLPEDARAPPARLPRAAARHPGGRGRATADALLAELGLAERADDRVEAALARQPAARAARRRARARPSCWCSTSRSAGSTRSASTCWPACSASAPRAVRPSSSRATSSSSSSGSARAVAIISHGRLVASGPVSTARAGDGRRRYRVVVEGAAAGLGRGGAGRARRRQGATASWRWSSTTAPTTRRCSTRPGPPAAWRLRPDVRPAAPGRRLPRGRRHEPSEAGVRRDRCSSRGASSASACGSARFLVSTLVIVCSSSARSS